MTAPANVPAPSPPPPPDPARTSRFAAQPEPTTASGQDAIELEVQSGLLRRLLADAPRAELAHLFGVACVLAILWGAVEYGALITWAGAIVTCVAVREVVRRRLSRSPPDFEIAVRQIRWVMTVTGLVWGTGAAALMPGVAFEKIALLLVILSGLTAGAAASLVADLWSFRFFAAGLLAPVPVGLIGSAGSRDDAVAILLIAVFGAAMVVFHGESHRLIFTHLRHTAVSARRESQAQRDRTYLDGLLAGAPVAIGILDVSGRIRGVNPQFERLFGFTSAEVLGRDLNEVIVPKSEQPKAGRLDLRTRRGETVVVEIERRRKDGRLIPVRATARRVGESDDADIFVMYEDITDRRRAQDAMTQLASIVESSADAIIGQTLDGTIVSWNAAAHRLFGYSLGEVQGRSIAMLAPPNRAAEVSGILDRIGRGEHIEHFETVRLRKDGAPIQVSLSISLTRDAGGRISGFSTIARDVGEQVTTREALREARDAAERLAKTRSDFLANMSHEIRTPLNAVLGLTELLLDTELAPEQRHSLGLIQSSGENLLTLINDILDFSKIEAEHLQLESIPFDLPHLVDSTIGLLAVRARERRLEVIADVTPGVPRIRGDPTRLRQILTNLIGNAVKFTPQGEIVVTATPAGERGGRAVIRFAVRDTGIGIPAEKLATIFEEFSQADASTTREYGGTGLGLAICRRLVTLMDGDLTVVSTVGAGTEFSFSLPFDVDPAPPAASAGAIAGRRVLVVDDNESNRRIVRGVLAGAGMHVDAAADGPEALLTLRRARDAGTPFDAMVLDRQMPELDGFALAEAVRSDPRIADTRLLLLTSAGERGDGQRCRDLGIQGYLTKPASRADLIETVSAVLGLAAAPPASAAPPSVVTKHSIAEARRHLRILLAEDNPVNQEVAAAMLRKRGHRVDVVDDGRAAVQAVAGAMYDVVLMDIQMPEMDGFEATAAIRATGAALPIVALTAHALSGERERCLAAGMSDYVTKPFKAHELFAIVEGRPLPSEAAAAVQAATAQPVDIAGFRQQMREAGAEDAVAGILQTFLETAPDRLAAVAAALRAGSAADIERAAHALKSAAGTIGARSLAAVLQEIEAAAKGGAVATARGLADRLRTEGAAVESYLKRMSGEPGAA